MDGSMEQRDNSTVRDASSRPLKEINQQIGSVDRSDRTAARSSSSTTMANSASTWISGERFSGLMEPTNEQFDEVIYLEIKRLVSLIVRGCMSL
jgi:hypothetical protein